MIHKLQFRAMGCHMLAALDSTSVRAQERLANVPAWFEDWEQTLSRFREDSELSRLNRSSSKDWNASSTLWQVFRASLEAERLSAGLVNPLVFGAILASGYTASFESLSANQPSNDSWLETTPVPRLTTIEWSANQRIIHLPSGVGLDFGGVAKGWAAHQAMQRLRTYGPALVDAGGDIAISGLQTNGEPWLVGVEDPFQPDSNRMLLQVGRSGIATSGRDYRHWQKNGLAQHHLIDPRTGLPAETDVFSATVIAPDLLQAETAAKTALILGSQTGLSWLKDHPALAGLLILEDGRSLQTDNLETLVA